MLLFVEFILTIIAWKRGWKWWAILPAAIAMIAGFIVDLVVGALGMHDFYTGLVSIILDAFIILALVIMIIRRRQVKAPGNYPR
jgi:hypothetical protein